MTWPLGRYYLGYPWPFGADCLIFVTFLLMMTFLLHHYTYMGKLANIGRLTRVMRPPRAFTAFAYIWWTNGWVIVERPFTTDWHSRRAKLRKKEGDRLRYYAGHCCCCTAVIVAFICCQCISNSRVRSFSTSIVCFAEGRCGQWPL